MTERTEYWWVEWCEGMPPEPARIGFEGDTPTTIEEIGGYTQPLADREVRLIERVLPAGRAAAVVAKLESIGTTCHHIDQVWDDLYEAVAILQDGENRA
ncbi:hypothetical protein [Methylobacterium aquaticum]|uniref:Uncharacterized protein n=1 Tax=Methylobacterium aquaticum TaxID=270351 RepID=A0A0C6FV42_9HYPH|nr:hypothetical protein [Methylobacterium aquaticum]BAQ49449.1 hypothetical protein Maq22A_1p36180 [Methylobacterium aquaticum]